MKRPDWSLVQHWRDGRLQVGTLLDDDVVVEGPPALAGRTLLDALADWDDLAVGLRSWTPDPTRTVPEARLAAPIVYPRKVLCAGANYYTHIAEMGIPRPDTPPEPWFFFKPPTTAVIGPGAAIRLPRDPGAQVDWEVELGVVIGRRCADVDRDEAMDHVAGYVVANDISARHRLTRADAVAEPFTYDWVGHKGRDTFCPLGPGLVPSWLVPDPQHLQIALSLNGVSKQNGTTSDMISPIVDLLAAASRLVTLEPGDVVLTGTPAGVGVPRGEFLSHGDRLVAEIELVGRLANPVVSG